MNAEVIGVARGVEEVTTAEAPVDARRVTVGAEARLCWITEAVVFTLGVEIRQPPGAEVAGLRAEARSSRGAARSQPRV